MTSTRGKGREGGSRKEGSKLVYRLLLLTADLGLSGDVDSLAGLGLENLAGGDGGRMRGCCSRRRIHGPVDRELVQTRCTLQEYLE